MAGYPPRGPFDNLRTGAQGMFGGLSRGFKGGANALNPYSNRLLAFSAGMLGGGPSDAMKGLIAGSALDRESADRKKLNEAIAGLKGQSGVLSGLNDADWNYLSAAGPEAVGGAFAAGLKGPDYGDKYQGYQMAKAEGYEGSWMDYQKEFKGDGGVTINTGGNLPTGYRFIDPNNPSAGAERIEGVDPHRSEGEQKGDVLLATVEPDYQTALETFGALSNPGDLAASYGGDIGRYFQSGSYQAGSDAITSIAQSYIYAVSGAQAPEQEVRRVAQLVTPALSDKPETLELKKQRLGSMVEAIRQKSGTPALVSPDDPLGVR